MSEFRYMLLMAMQTAPGHRDTLPKECRHDVIELAALPSSSCLDHTSVRLALEIIVGSFPRRYYLGSGTTEQILFVHFAAKR